VFRSSEVTHTRCADHRYAQAALRLLTLAGSLGCVVVLNGCGGSGGNRDAEAVNVGLDTLAAADVAGTDGPTLPEGEVATGQSSISDRVAQQIRDLDALMGNAIASAQAPPPRPETGMRDVGAGGAPDPAGNPLVTIDTPPTDATALATPPGTDGMQGTSGDTGMGLGLAGLLGEDEQGDEASERIEALALEIERLVQSRVPSSNSPFRDALALVAADLLRPDGPTGTDTIDPLTLESLSPTERETLEALRSSLREVAGASPSEVATAMGEASQRLEQALGARIGRIELCSRVDSFGSYVPFAGTDFLARQGNRALVYVEVERFSHRAVGGNDRVTTPGDRWAVDLSQEMRLYHKADGRLAWRKASERVIDTSRNRRRDFYLVTEIELPPSLTVGSYELQVTIKDETTGSTDVLAVPIGIVADPGLVTARP
jgi:hypothetical protein